MSPILLMQNTFIGFHLPWDSNRLAVSILENSCHHHNKSPLIRTFMKHTLYCRGTYKKLQGEFGVNKIVAENLMCDMGYKFLFYGRTPEGMLFSCGLAVHTHAYPLLAS